MRWRCRNKVKRRNRRPGVYPAGRLLFVFLLEIHALISRHPVIKRHAFGVYVVSLCNYWSVKVAAFGSGISRWVDPQLRWLPYRVHTTVNVGMEAALG